MHVWVLTNEYEPWLIGGLGIVATKLSRALSHLGLTVTVIARSKGESGSTIDHQMQLLRVLKSGPFYSPQRHRFNTESILKEAERYHICRPDIIQVHSVDFANLALYMKQKYNIPIVYTCHSLVSDEPPSDTRAIVMKRQERLLAGADRIVVPSEWQRQGLISAYPAHAERVLVITNGVDILECESESNRAVVQIDEWDNSESNVRLLFVGRIIPQKGIEELLYSIALLRQAGWPVTLDVVGRGGRRYEERLAEVAATLQVSDFVNWLGFQSSDKMKEVYQEHDLVVVPSKIESFGLVALEAMAYGVPLVSTQSGGLSEFIDSQVAHTITSGKHESIAEVVQLMLTNPDEVVARVRKGCTRAMQYSWGRIASQYQALFHQVVLDSRESASAVLAVKGGLSWHKRRGDSKRKSRKSSKVVSGSSKAR